jgi:hypothetical protein
MFPHSEGMSARFPVTFTHWAQSEETRQEERIVKMKRLKNRALLDMGGCLGQGRAPVNPASLSFMMLCTKNPGARVSSPAARSENSRRAAAGDSHAPFQKGEKDEVRSGLGSAGVSPARSTHFFPKNDEHAGETPVLPATLCQDAPMGDPFAVRNLHLVLNEGFLHLNERLFHERES